MAKAIYFDMDGTIADLYGVENWLPKLRAYDTTPYTEAKPMLHFATLARLLNKRQREGYIIGVISWGSKCATPAYDEAVAEAKRAWLAKHLPSVKWDEIHITPYGVPKSEVADIPQGILFDDNTDIRNSWANGIAYEPSAILEVLKTLAY